MNRCFVSKVANTREIGLYDMTIPKIDEWINNPNNFSSEESDRNFSNDLLRIPLLLSSMIKVKNDTDVFKPEYIIPQQIMETIIEFNHNQRKKLYRHAIGVIYTTVHQYEDFFPSNAKTSDEFDLRINVAIPIQNPDCDEYCDQLTSIFRITRPTCEEFERAKRPLNKEKQKTSFNSNHDTSNKQSIQPIHETDSYEYPNSIFGLLEARLDCLDRFKLIDLSKQSSPLQHGNFETSPHVNKEEDAINVLSITDDSIKTERSEEIQFKQNLNHSSENNT